MSLRQKRTERFRNADLYLVITSEFTAGRGVLDVLDAAGRGGIKLVQLREKSLCDRDLCKLAKDFRRICDEYGILMIMNDHVDIALYSGADGVHLGQTDLTMDAARSIAPDMIIGRSTHSVEQAVEAQKQGADYINLGPIYATATKQTPVKPLGTEIIRATKPHLNIPFSVMGGIKKQHIPLLLEEGARVIAMVTEVTAAPNIEERVRELRKLWE